MAKNAPCFPYIALCTVYQGFLRDCNECLLLYLFDCPDNKQFCVPVLEGKPYSQKSRQRTKNADRYSDTNWNFNAIYPITLAEY